MFPVRCYTCNAVVGHMWSKYDDGVRAGRRAGDIMDEMHVRRMCCRRMFLGHVDLIRHEVHHPNMDVSLDRGGTILKRVVTGTRRVECE